MTTHRCPTCAKPLMPFSRDGVTMFCKACNRTVKRHPKQARPKRMSRKLPGFE
jgi:uncharacterized Zn finger protein (UPF0148 family)